MEINYTFYFFAFLRKMIKKLLTFCYWTRKKELFDNALHTVYNELKSWPEERYFVRDGGFKNWMLELEKKASNHEVLEANYRMKFEKYKIEKLPERPFCF